MEQFMICIHWVGDYNKTWGVPMLQPQAVTEHDAIRWTDVNRKSVKVKVNSLMYGKWALATGLSSLLLAYCNKNPRIILI